MLALEELLKILVRFNENNDNDIIELSELGLEEIVHRFKQNNLSFSQKYYEELIRLKEFGRDPNEDSAEVVEAWTRLINRLIQYFKSTELSFDREIDADQLSSHTFIMPETISASQYHVVKKLPESAVKARLIRYCDDKYREFFLSIIENPHYIDILTLQEIDFSLLDINSTGYQWLAKLYFCHNWILDFFDAFRKNPTFVSFEKKLKKIPKYDGQLSMAIWIKFCSNNDIERFNTTLLPPSTQEHIIWALKGYINDRVPIKSSSEYKGYLQNLRKLQRLIQRVSIDNQNHDQNWDASKLPYHTLSENNLIGSLLQVINSPSQFPVHGFVYDVILMAASHAGNSKILMNYIFEFELLEKITLGCLLNLYALTVAFPEYAEKLNACANATISKALLTSDGFRSVFPHASIESDEIAYTKFVKVAYFYPTRAVELVNFLLSHPAELNQLTLSNNCWFYRRELGRIGDFCGKMILDSSEIIKGAVVSICLSPIFRYLPNDIIVSIAVMIAEGRYHAKNAREHTAKDKCERANAIPLSTLRQHLLFHQNGEHRKHHLSVKDEPRVFLQDNWLF